MVTNVYWALGARGFFCHGILMHFFAGKLWPLPEGLEFKQIESLPTEPAEFGIVVLPGAWIHDKNLYEEVEAGLRFLDRCLILHSGDEELAMDAYRFVAGLDKRRLLQQAPRPGMPNHGTLLYGWPEDTRELLARMPDRPANVRRLWSFIGQINHAFREDMRNELLIHEDGECGHMTFSEGFAASTSGVPREDYLDDLGQARVIPCPSGPQSPETFRLYEALEAGCIPIAQRRAPAGPWPEGFNYWTWRYGSVPFPTVEKWSEAHQWLDLYADPEKAQPKMTECLAWWQAEKRKEAVNLLDEIGAEKPDVTVIITSSPVPSHPSTQMLENCISNIRSQPGLEKAEILLMLDGVRPELEHRRKDYEEYLRRVVNMCNWREDWFGILPVVSQEWVHQAELLRRALTMVRSPVAAFFEHDTFVIGYVPWKRLIDEFKDSILSPNLVRLHIFESILPEHEHLYKKTESWNFSNDAWLLQTKQWSQRPHLFRVSWMKGLLDKYFPIGCKGFIEDRLCSPCEAGEVTGLYVYAPNGSMLRSGTWDGRGADPKAEAYQP